MLRIIPWCIVSSLIVFSSSITYANSTKLDDMEICHLANYTIERSLKNVKSAFENFKKNEGKDLADSKIKLIGGWLNDQTKSLAFTLSNIKRAIGKKEYRTIAKQLRDEHNINSRWGCSPLYEIINVKFNTTRLTTDLVYSKKLADIDMVMNEYKAEVQAEEARARIEERKELERKRQKAKQELLEAQQQLEAQRKQDAENEKIRAETEELNRIKAQIQAERAELEKLEAERAEILRLKQKLEVEKFRLEEEAKYKEERETLRLEKEKLEHQQTEIMLQRKKEEVIRQANEAKRRADLNAEKERQDYINLIFSMMEMYRIDITTTHQKYKKQLELGTPRQKEQARKALNYTSEALGLLNEAITICNHGKINDDFSDCKSRGSKKIEKVGYIMKELEELVGKQR